jgi:hypothetical protein
MRDESPPRGKVRQGAPRGAEELTRSVRERSRPRGCCKDRQDRIRLVVGRSVRRPSVEVLAHGGQHHAKEPVRTACDAGMVEAEVEFLAFDGTLSARAAVGVEFPER